MNDPTPQEQPRVPGVRYKPETRYRAETTVIDGKPSTRNVPYEVLVPQPPRDWDELILRGVTGLAVGITTLAVIGTTASVGGQLTEILHPVISYGVGVVFTATWLACLGLEWVSRVDPQRARPARIGGWIALVISMLAVFSYGHDHGQDIAGGVGASIDLLAKGLWALLIHAHRVPLSEGIRHWLTDQEQEAAGTALLSGRLTRLNRREAYQRAVGGREYQAASAIVTTDESQALPAAQPVEYQPAPAPPPPVEAPSPPEQQPPTTPSGQAAPASGQPAGQVSTPTSGPAPVPPVGPAGGQPPVSLVGGSIAETVRLNLANHPEWKEDDHLDDLVEAVRDVHGDDPKLKETVRRSRDRAKNPRPRKKKAS